MASQSNRTSSAAEFGLSRLIVKLPAPVGLAFPTPPNRNWTEAELPPPVMTVDTTCLLPVRGISPENVVVGKTLKGGNTNPLNAGSGSVPSDTRVEPL